MINTQDLRQALAAIGEHSHYTYLGVRGSGRDGACALLVDHTATGLAYAIQEAGWLYPDSTSFDLLGSYDEAAPETTCYEDGTARPPVGSMLPDARVLASINVADDTGPANVPDKHATQRSGLSGGRHLCSRCGQDWPSLAALDRHRREIHSA